MIEQPDFKNKNIEDVFDIANPEHIKEYIYLDANGTWKEASIFTECKFSSCWQILLLQKLADGYLHYWTRMK